MADDTPKTLAHFGKTFNSVPDRRSSFTLTKFLERKGITDSNFVQLSSVVSQTVYNRYAQSARSGYKHQFAKFLSERCTDLDDALDTPEYKKASNAIERKGAIMKWMNKIKAQESNVLRSIDQLSLASSPVPIIPKVIVDEVLPRNDIETDILGFYGKFVKLDSAKQHAKKVTTPSVVVHNTAYQTPKTQNIVVQPSPKPKNVVQKADAFSDYINRVNSGKGDEIPRAELEKFASHLENAIKSGQDLSKVYKIVLDLTHGGFDCCDPEQVSNALTIAKNHGLVNLPKRERRALVDVINRGSTDLHDQLTKSQSDCFNYVVNNKAALRKLADQDLLKIAPRIAKMTKIGDSKETQAYVLGHNEMPILRVLLNSEQNGKLAQYLSFRKLANANFEKGSQVPFASNSTCSWDSNLSENAPYTDGHVKIYASAPYRDDISYFRKWVKDSGCDQKKCVWLAPTDEVIISQKINEGSDQWTPEQKKDFVMAHLVKNGQSLTGNIKKVAAGQKPWISNFQMNSGKEGKALHKTRIVFDKVSESAFVPIGYVLN